MSVSEEERKALRSEQEMLDLILRTAQTDARIRAVIMNGSRVNPNARRDLFQDFDIVYLVTDVAPFRCNLAWIERFGERMMLQMPDAMGDAPAESLSFAYLMQFADGNRIDLTFFPVAAMPELGRDTLSVLLLDKDGLVQPFDPPHEGDYLPTPPAARRYADCCNEFWWVATYVAKGLWREELLYARAMLDQVVRVQLMTMLTWYAGMQTGFTRALGKQGKALRHVLTPEEWALLMETFADADYDHNWDALMAMCTLFRRAALPVAEHFGFDYPHEDDRRVSAHLERVRSLPKDATAL